MKAFKLSESRYEHGAAAYTEVLDMQRAAVAAEQLLISAQLARASSFVTLYKVLGGGALEEQPAEGDAKGMTSSAEVSPNGAASKSSRRPNAA